MTLPSMESSEMSQETESGEVQEIVESPEVQETAQALEQATFEPEAVVELEGNHEEAEVVEAAFVEVMKGAETSAAEGGRPGGGVEATPINLPNPVEEAAVLPVPIPGPQGETGDSTAIIDSNDGSGDVALSPDDVKIDTVPLPEKPETLASHTEKASDDVAIGTWPTPERTVDGVSIIDSNDGPRAQQRIKPELDNDSDSPPPPPTLDSNNMEIPEDMRDGPPGRSDSGLEMQKTVEVPDERSDVLQSAGAADEGSGGERTLKYDGREEDKFDPGVEQKFDPHQENRIKDGYGSVAGTGGRVEDIGLQDGDRAADMMPGHGADMDVMDGLGGRDLPGPGDLIDLPGLGEKHDLDAPGVGADPRIGAKPATDDIGGATAKPAAGTTSSSKSAPIGAGHLADPSGGSKSSSNNNDKTTYRPVSRTKGERIWDDVKDITGEVWDFLTDPDGQGPGPDTAPDGHVGVRTPNPEGGDGEHIREIVIGGRTVGVSPGKVLDQSGKPLDYRKSMSQPVDDEGQGRERPVNLKESLDASLDQNINWGDDSSGGLSSPDKKVNLEPDNKLVDPPDFTSGEGESGGKNPPK